MRVRALKTFAHATPVGMIVLNAAKGGNDAGEADIPNEIAESYIAAGLAEAVARDPLDHDGDGARGGSLKGDASTSRRGAAAKAAESEQAPAQDAAP